MLLVIVLLVVTMSCVCWYIIAGVVMSSDCSSSKVVRLTCHSL